MPRGEPRPPRPPRRGLAAVLIALILIGASAGVWFGLKGVSTSTRHGKSISCNDSALSIVVGGQDSVVASGGGARSNQAAHLCFRASEQQAAISSALVFGPLIVIVAVASGRRSGRRNERLS